MHKPCIHPDTFIGAALVLFIIIIVGLLSSYPGIFPSKKVHLACTEEVKTCADGSIVTRRGPVCDFSPCLSGEMPLKPGIIDAPFEATPATPSAQKQTPKTPPVKKEVLCTMEAKMCSDGSFVGRVAPSCDFAPCPVLPDKSNTGSHVSL